MGRRSVLSRSALRTGRRHNRYLQSLQHRETKNQLRAKRRVTDTLDQIKSPAKRHGLTIFVRVNFGTPAAAPPQPPT
jgi:hypothetical protein